MRTPDHSSEHWQTVQCNEDEKAKKDWTQTSLHHLGEEEAVNGDIKGLGHVNGAHEHLFIKM